VEIAENDAAYMTLRSRVVEKDIREERRM